MKYRRVPCDECPFRRDAGLLPFPPERYDDLRSTVRDEGGREAPFGSPMFGCHKSGVEAIGCAGWIAVCGHEHLTVRVAAFSDAGVREILTHGGRAEGWPELVETYDEMAERQQRGTRR